MGERQDARWARRAERPVMALAAVLVAAGCMSVPESRYYTLNMSDSEQAATAFQVQVGRFRTSDALSRPEILIQASPTRVEYYALDLWASDLAEMVQEKLQVELGPAASPTYRIEGDILAFEQVDQGGEANARVRLRVRAYDATDRRSSEPVFRKTYQEVRSAAEATPEGVVLALSDGLEAIAVQIGADLSTL